ncbi:MAG: hypothetical protein WBL68_16240, partial [Nitrososphaeraceae archaeon]
NSKNLTFQATNGSFSRGVDGLSTIKNIQVVSDSVWQQIVMFRASKSDPLGQPSRQTKSKVQ